MPLETYTRRGEKNWLLLIAAKSNLTKEENSLKDTKQSIVNLYCFEVA